MEKNLVVKNTCLKTFSVRARWKSFRFAFAGLLRFFKEEHNAIIHLSATLAVVIAVVIIPISKMEMIAVLFAVGFVWASELFNTAIEKLADMTSKDIDPKIKYIKDVSAAAVLVAAITALTIGMLVFIPKIFS